MLSVLRFRLLAFWGGLHIGETIRRRALQRAVRRYASPGMHVLDAGCGRGDNALWFARQYPTSVVHAVDIDPTLVTSVQRRAADAGVRNVFAEQGDIEHSPFTIHHSSFLPCGIVWSVDVFEHLRDPARALQQLATVLAPGGTLILHVPRAKQQRWFRRFDHYDQHDHERDGFEPEELAGLMRAAGLNVEAIRHTFGPPGALAWELFHLAQGIGKWCALLTYPIPWFLAWIDGLSAWKRGNGMLIVASNVKRQSSNVKSNSKSERPISSLSHLTLI